jgi:hypothetical protein
VYAGTAVATQLQSEIPTLYVSELGANEWSRASKPCISRRVDVEGYNHIRAVAIRAAQQTDLYISARTLAPVPVHRVCVCVSGFCVFLELKRWSGTRQVQ